jgi:hypothetical protein
MNIYVMEKRIVFTGKVWEVRRKLKEAAANYEKVSDWINSGHSEKRTVTLQPAK